MEIRAFVTEVSWDDPRAYATTPDGKKVRMARTLREAIAKFGGEEFALPVVPDADLSLLGVKQSTVSFSLKDWRGRDLDETIVLIGYETVFTEEEAHRLGKKHDK